MKEGPRFFSRRQKRELLEQQEYICGGCGKSVWKQRFNTVHIHHIVPNWAGGNTDNGNGIALCPSCHADQDNLALLGEIYPEGYTLDDADSSQIRNTTLFDKSRNKVDKNKRNTRLVNLIRGRVMDG